MEWVDAAKELPSEFGRYAVIESKDGSCWLGTQEFFPNVELTSWGGYYEVLYWLRVTLPDELAPNAEELHVGRWTLRQ